jgi:Fe2+ transport system protein FeoA
LRSIKKKVWARLNKWARNPEGALPVGWEKSLAGAAHGVWHQVESLTGPEDGCYRLLDLGFTPGAEVKIAQAAPLGEPLIVVLRGTRLALRKNEAAWIIVK